MVRSSDHFRPANVEIEGRFWSLELAVQDPRYPAPVASLTEYLHLATGKVRELYEVNDEVLLMVASDRISAYDHVLPTAIPDKGRVLTAMSVFWFELLADLVPSHVVAVDDPAIRRRSGAGRCWCGGWRCCRSNVWRAGT